MDDVNVEVLSDIACHLGEGPTYDPASDTLFWFDILERKLLERRFPDGAVAVHELPEMASALAVVDKGHQLLVTETGLQRREVATGRVAMHMPVEADRPHTRSNDARVHPSGALWFGTMGKKAEHGAGAIYWFRAGELRLLYPDITIPNSICFSADGAAAFFTDTAENILYRVACEPASGLPTGEPGVFVDWRGKKGGLDGSIVDADGVLWNARCEAGALDAWSPGGELVRTIAIPASRTTCPAFVGPAADRIAVTSAYEHMDAEVRRAEPRAGQTFLVELPVKGRFEPYAVL